MSPRRPEADAEIQTQFVSFVESTAEPQKNTRKAIGFSFRKSFSAEFVFFIIESLRLRFGIVILPSRLLPKREFDAKKIF